MLEVSELAFSGRRALVGHVKPVSAQITPGHRQTLQMLESTNHVQVNVGQIEVVEREVRECGRPGQKHVAEEVPAHTDQ